MNLNFEINNQTEIYLSELVKIENSSIDKIIERLINEEYLKKQQKITNKLNAFNIILNSGKSFFKDKSIQSVKAEKNV